MFFAVFKHLESTFSEDNIPGHAVDTCIENATKMVKAIPSKAKNKDQNLR